MMSSSAIFIALLASHVAQAEPQPAELEPAATASTTADSWAWLKPPWKGIYLRGGYRVGSINVSDMRVDADGRNYEQTKLLAHRLWLRPEATIASGLEFKGELQLASGLLSYNEPHPFFRTAGGPDSNTNYGPPRSSDGAAFGKRAHYGDQLALRKLYLTWTTMLGQLRVGRMPSHWGMGLLANGGDDETQDWGMPRFGRDRNYGDVVDRLVFIGQPLMFIDDNKWTRRWQVGIGIDSVVRDERIWRDAGDQAMQTIGVLRYAGPKDREVGIYVARRDMTDRDGAFLDVWAYDAFGQGSYELGDVEIYGKGEIAWVDGTTSIGRNVAVQEMVVQQLGYAVQAGARYNPLSLAFDVELGYASGDTDSGDTYQRGFSFDPEYNPSLILFDELRAAETVASAAHASDPEFKAYPDEAVRHLPSRGSVSNAIYVRPTLRYVLDQSVRTRVALMWARSEEDVYDPYNSSATLGAGGTPHNFQGGLGSDRDLGIEVNAGIDFLHRFDQWVELNIGLQGGMLWPGMAFANAGGERVPRIDLVYVRLLATWLPETSN